MLKFSDIGIYAGGNADPAANATALRSWAAAGKSVMIDDASAPYDFATGGTPINLAFSQLAIMPESQRCALRHVSGSGKFLDFDGQVNYPTSNAAKRIYFGEPDRPIMVRGFSGTTDLMHIAKLADCHFHTRLRDADLLCRVDAAGQTGTDLIGLVEGTLDITSSPDWDDEAFTVGSRYGLNGAYLFSCQMRLNIENSGRLNGSVVSGAGYATYLDNSNRNEIKPGSSNESNGAGGMWLTSTCEGNAISSTDNEANSNGSATNGSLFDLVVRGTRTTVRNFAGRCEINGYNNIFEGCSIPNSVVNSLGTNSKHSFIACDLTGWTDNGNHSWVRNCTVPDKN